VDFLFVGALDHAALVGRRLADFQNTHGLTGRHITGIRVAFGRSAFAAARSTGVFTLLFRGRIIPFSLFAEDDAVLGPHFLALGFGSQTLVTLHAPAFAALRVEGIGPAGADRVGNTVDDAMIRILDVLTDGNLASAWVDDLVRDGACGTRLGRWRGARLPLAFQGETSALIGLVDHVFAGATHRHLGLLAQLILTSGVRAAAHIGISDEIFAHGVATDRRLGGAWAFDAFVRFAAARVNFFLDFVANGARGWYGRGACAHFAYLRCALALVSNGLHVFTFGAIG